MKVYPYIETIGCEEFKLFLNRPFSTNMLYPLCKEDCIDVYFSDWRGKDMGTWNKFTNEEDIVLEFYPNHYITIFPKSNVKIISPLLITINDFVNDMCKFKVQLCWSELIDEMFDPKDYLPVEKIKQYFIDLLTKMEKIHELHI